MAIIRPFRALRPVPDAAARVAAVPYDVVNVEEARDLASGNPLSFLHVSRAEIDLPADLDPHDDRVYHAAAENYRRLKHQAPFVEEDRPSLYLYRLAVDGHAQTGVAACFSIDEYDSNAIKKHERTRRDKEDDRTRHIVELKAQTGPVFLTHRPEESLDQISQRVRSSARPLVDFRAPDGIQHTLWRLDSRDERELIEAFAAVDTLYIADGHHRAASAARARGELRSSKEGESFLGVAFPADQVRILSYNRVVSELNGMSAGEFLEKVKRRFVVTSDTGGVPARKGEMSMYLAGRWHSVDLDSGRTPGGGVFDSLDGNILQEEIFKPLLDLVDVRTDTRIDFVGGIKGPGSLERLVDEGKVAVAFAMYPVAIADLMDVSDAGEIMPPKSTWFEPKLRDGLLIHEI